MFHTWHRNTFGLLYGATTKTACDKRRPTGTLVPPLSATCPDCQAAVIAHLLEVHEMYQFTLAIAKDHGYDTIKDFNEALTADLAQRRGQRVDPLKR